MRRNQDRQTQPSWAKLVGGICVFLALSGGYGLVLVAVCVGFYFWHQKNKKREDAGESFLPPRKEAVMEEFPRSVETEDRELALVHAKSSFDTPQEHQDRHVQELKDLLKAGIIEQDEYNDRLRSFK